MNEVDRAAPVSQHEHGILAVEELFDVIVQPVRVMSQRLSECHGS